MNSMIKPLALAAILLAGVSVGTVQVQAQGRRNFDPAQFRQRMMDRYREALEITKDDEWQAIEPLIQKVMDARMQVGFGGGRMMFRRGGPPPGGAQDGNPPPRRPRFGPPPMPEAEALQQALDSKASNDDLKVKLEAYRQARKTKEAAVTEAQDNLRKVLTVRQEATAVLMGLLQ
jgi:hypothetical protein